MEFHHYLNSLHPTIQFDITHSTTEINVLNTTIYVNTEGHLESKLYIKLTDICTLLHAGSFHPNSFKGSLIYSQAFCYRRVITDNSTLEIQLTRLRENLLRRGYEVSDINNEFQKITNLTQSDLLFRKKHDKSNHNTLPFIIPYDQTNKLIGPIARKHWEIIENDPLLHTIWPKPPILALKRNQNLHD